MKMVWLRIIGGLIFLLWASGAEAVAPQQVTIDQFGKGLLFTPSTTPKSFLVVLSPSTGWDDAATMIATELAKDGAAVLGLDVQAYYANRALSKDECLYPTGLIEDMAEKLQRRFAEQAFERPVLIGLGDSGALATLTTMQTLPGTYRSVIAPAFCPPVLAPKLLCIEDDVQVDGQIYRPQDMASVVQIARLHLAKDTHCTVATPPWPIEALAADPLTYIRASLNADQRAVQTDSIATLASLPLTFLPAHDHNNDWLIVFVSGDGGWRDIDRQIGGALQQFGFAVVGFDSLQYFWRKKTPVQTAITLDKIIIEAAREWGKRKIALVGYSFGADLLPFSLPLMKTKDLVHHMTLIGLAKDARLEITVGGFLGHGDKNLNTRAALKQISSVPTLCVYGDEELADGDTICPFLTQDNVEKALFPGGHHYNQDYHKIAATMVASMRKVDDHAGKSDAETGQDNPEITP